MRLKDRAEKLKVNIPALRLSLKSKETPWFAKALAGLTVAYALSPIDLIPDFIPVLGYLDDLILLPALVALTVRCIPKETFARYQAKACGLCQDGKPKKWYYALPILLVWALVICLVLKVIL